MLLSQPKASQRSFIHTQGLDSGGLFKDGIWNAGSLEDQAEGQASETSTDNKDGWFFLSHRIHVEMRMSRGWDEMMKDEEWESRFSGTIPSQVLIQKVRAFAYSLCDMSTFPILHKGTIGREINRFGGFIIRRSQEAPSRFKYHDREGHGAGDVCRPPGTISELYLRTYYFEIRRPGTYLVSNFGRGRSGCSSGRGAGIASKLPGLDQTWLWDGFDGTLVLNQG